VQAPGQRQLRSRWRLGGGGPGPGFGCRNAGSYRPSVSGRAGCAPFGEAESASRIMWMQQSGLSYDERAVRHRPLPADGAPPEPVAADRVGLDRRGNWKRTPARMAPRGFDRQVAAFRFRGAVLNGITAPVKPNTAGDGWLCQRTAKPGRETKRATEPLRPCNRLFPHPTT
jgi:hypothetical protein